jgi:hypothetical protein
MTSASRAAIVTILVAPLAACATSRGPRQIDAVEANGTPTIWAWSRVGELAPGTEVMVTARGVPPRDRYFVLADEFAVTVLNLADATLAGASTRTLRDMASHHPEYFAAMQTGGTFGQDNVRLGRDGVFVANRKVAELGQVVETIARNEISEIRGPVIARGSVPGAILGGWLGFAVGVVPALGGAAKVVAWPVLIGSVAGGGFLGYRWSSHEAEGIIYRAP